MDLRPATVITTMTTRDGRQTAVVSVVLTRAPVRAALVLPEGVALRDGQQIIVAVEHGDELTFHADARKEPAQEPRQSPWSDDDTRQWCRDVATAFADLGGTEIRVYETDEYGDRRLVGSNVKGEVR
jgi:predicted NAD/FAD-binding protein